MWGCGGMRGNKEKGAGEGETTKTYLRLVP